MPVICGRRTFGSGGKCLEYGILRMFYRILFYLAPDDAEKYGHREDYCGFDSRQYVIETMLSGVAELPFAVFAAAMQPIHLAIGFVEGCITAAVLVFVYQARPELLKDSAKAEADGKISYKKTLGILTMLALLIGGGLSLAASAYPDGLEWSIERITGSTDLNAAGTKLYETAEKVQTTTALLPDYAFKDSESLFGTSFSGIAGALAVLVVCAGVCYLFRFFKKKRA